MSAAILLMVTFSELLTGSELDLYCDNTAQEGALVKGSSRAWDLAVVAGHFWQMAAKVDCDVWVDRVPTDFNVSDYPTRFISEDENGFVRAIQALGFSFVPPKPLKDLFETLERLRASASLRK